MADQQLYTNPTNGLTYAYGGDGANCTISVCPTELSIYGYRPSIPFSATLLALYGMAIAAHVYLGIRYKKWGFMVTMALGCVTEIIGYVGRILYNQNPWDDAGFLIQISEPHHPSPISDTLQLTHILVLITIGPVFFAAAIYVLLYQIVNYIDRSASRVNPKFFYWVFIPADIISLVLQAAGGAMSASSDGGSETEAGVDIALAGLGFQVATLTFFAVCVLDYMWRSRQIWTSTKLSKRFISFCVFLALATVLILVRCSYRVYELSEGYSRDSEALRDEKMFNGLEGV
jgi:hypothetical protein